MAAATGRRGGAGVRVCRNFVIQISFVRNHNNDNNDNGNSNIVYGINNNNNNTRRSYISGALCPGVG